MICKNGNAKTYTSCNTHQSDAAEVDVTRTESTDAELNEGDLLQITGFSCTVQVEICKSPPASSMAAAAWVLAMGSHVGGGGSGQGKQHGEVVVGALVSILLVPVVGLVVVAALLLLVAAGAVLLLLLLAVGQRCCYC
eukprot:Em0367g2a